MPKQAKRPTTITPGQAQFVLERLVAEHRISPSDIRRYVADMQREISDLEERIASLRGLTTAAVPRPAIKSEARRKPRGTAGATSRRRSRRGNPLAGSYMGYMRQVKDERKKAEFKRVKESRGFVDAIAALKQYLVK